jgi:hypothetical protein
MNIPILSAGIACVIAGIVGGGFKAFGVEIPSLEIQRRQVTLALFGVVFIVASSTEIWTPFVAQIATSTRPKLACRRIAHRFTHDNVLYQAW